MFALTNIEVDHWVLNMALTKISSMPLGHMRQLKIHIKNLPQIGTILLLRDWTLSPETQIQGQPLK